MQCGMQFCESWLCKLALVSLSFFILDIHLYLSFSLSVSLSLSLSLSINHAVRAVVVAQSFSVLYCSTSGLHARTHGHALLGVVVVVDK